MGRDMNKLICLLKDESGATSIEYAFLAALIAVVAIVAMKRVGTQLTGTYNGVATGVANSTKTR